MITEQHIEDLRAAHKLAGQDLPGTLTDKLTGYRESFWVMDDTLVWTMEGDRMVSLAWWTNKVSDETTTTTIPLEFDANGGLTITHEQ